MKACQGPLLLPYNNTLTIPAPNTPPTKIQNSYQPNTTSIKKVWSSSVIFGRIKASNDWTPSSFVDVGQSVHCWKSIFEWNSMPLCLCIYIVIETWKISQSLFTRQNICRCTTDTYSIEQRRAVLWRKIWSLITTGCVDWMGGGFKKHKIPSSTFTGLLLFYHQGHISFWSSSPKSANSRVTARCLESVVGPSKGP